MKLPQTLVLQLLDAHDAIDNYIAANLNGPQTAIDKAFDALGAIFDLVTDEDVGSDELLAMKSNWNCFSELRKKLERSNEQRKPDATRAN